MDAHKNIPPAPDHTDRDKLRVWQANQLSAIRRLKENPDYLLIFPPRLQEMVNKFHDSICDISKTGEALEFARARYLAARSLGSLLDNLESALESAIKTESQDPNKKQSSSDVDKTIAISYGGWFDVAIMPAPSTE